MMNQIIFYGAGKFAEENIDIWRMQGITPVCFADGDGNKHGKQIKGVTVLSLDEALVQWPEADVYVTVGVDALGRVTDFLLKRGIPENRVKYPYAVEKRLGCKFLGTRIQFFGEQFQTCCSPQLGEKERVRYDVTDFEKNMDAYKCVCRNMIDTMRSGKGGCCTGCAQLRYDIWPVEPWLEVIGFDTAFEEDRCNFKCIYCNAKESITENCLKTNLVDTIKKFERYSRGEHKNIVLASGEISVSPYREEVFEIIKRNRWDVHVFTNASVYVPALAELLQSGQAKIQVSMDAGTKETFAKIKGVDFWDKVVENLARYAENVAPNQIELKYILIPGVNDLERDVDGFLELAKNVHAGIFLSSDMNVMEAALPEQTYQCALRLAKGGWAQKMNLSVVAEFFNPQSYTRLMKELYD